MWWKWGLEEKGLERMRDRGLIESGKVREIINQFEVEVLNYDPV